MADLRAENGRAEPWKVRMWGVGNENWACGGYMRPEYYADQYRQYVTYLRNQGDNRLYKIACGPYGEDLHWTEVLMRETQQRRLMHGLGMHFYCGSGREKQVATDGTEDDWYFLLNTAHRMDALLRAQIAVMDRYDSEDRVGLLVDEWGTWHLVEPGTNDGFLYQQNTIRDALAAALTLDIFNRHCRRVHGANIAQTVNVLQAMVLTEDERMVLTPTYHVFEMYAGHQDAVNLPCFVETALLGEGDTEVPGLSASASRTEDGSVLVTVSNLHASESLTVEVALHGLDQPALDGRILMGQALNSHNTFDDPERVSPQAYDGIRPTTRGCDIELPPRSLLALSARPG